MARNVINLEEIVREWAWREYKTTATSSQKKLLRKDTREPRKYLRLELDWSESTFRDETRWSPLAADETDSAFATAPNNVSHGMYYSRVRRKILYHVRQCCIVLKNRAQIAQTTLSFAL